MNELDSLEAKPRAVDILGYTCARFVRALQSGIERRPWPSFALFSAFYFVIVFSLSAMKLL